MPRLTKEKAIQMTRERWTELAETGRAEKGYCPLCVYDGAYLSDCKHCPYFKKYGKCNTPSFPYTRWCIAETTATKKKYAGEIVAQMDEL